MVGATTISKQLQESHARRSGQGQQTQSQEAQRVASMSITAVLRWPNFVVSLIELRTLTSWWCECLCCSFDLRVSVLEMPFEFAISVILLVLARLARGRLRNVVDSERLGG